MTPPSITCQGCDRSWSYPYPDVCPRCDYQMVESVPVPVVEPDANEYEDYSELDPPRHRHSYRVDGTCACGATHPLQQV